LEHEGVHVDEGGLEDAEAKHAHLLLVLAVRRDLATLAVVDDRVRAVERLDDVESFGDFALQVPVAEVGPR